MLEASARGEDGVEFFKERRVFMPQCTDSLGPVMVLGPDKKLGIARDTSFQPFRPTREGFRIAPPQGAKKVLLTLTLNYQLRPGSELAVHRWEKVIEAPAAPAPTAAH